MKLMVDLNKTIVDQWCEENGYGLIKLYYNDEDKPLELSLIKAEGIKGIIKRVTEHCDMKPSDVQINTRKREILEPRQICHTIANKHLSEPLKTIGWKIGKKDHATVINSSKTINKLIETDKAFNEKYFEIIKLYSLND